MKIYLIFALVCLIHINSNCQEIHKSDSAIINQLKHIEVLLQNRDIQALDSLIKWEDNLGVRSDDYILRKVHNYADMVKESNSLDYERFSVRPYSDGIRNYYKTFIPVKGKSLPSGFRVTFRIVDDEHLEVWDITIWYEKNGEETKMPTFN